MLWLYNTNKEFRFYQIFTDFNIVYNDSSNNEIYSFELNTNNNQFEINSKLFNDITPNIFTFDVKILDNIITWINTETKEENTFSMKMNFTDLKENENENELDLPFFSFVYKKINKNRMPILINKIYDLCSQYKFIIYNINADTQFIIETCLENGIKKKYFITNNIKSIKKYLK